MLKRNYLIKGDNMEKLFRKLEKDLQEIWDYAFGKDVVPDIRYCLKMYQMLADYWERLIKDKNGTIYSIGYDMICTSLGNMYLMFDTDIPEQDDIIYQFIME